MRATTLVVAFLLFALETATGALTVTATEKTCSSITIYVNSSLEPPRNNAVIIRILYSSSVHSGEVNYTVNAVLPHTEKLTYLVADTEYTITAIAEYVDRTTANGTITASTTAGTPEPERANISIISIGSTSLTINVTDPGPTAKYDCWINNTDHRLYRWERYNTTTVTGLCPGTYYNITCQKRPSNPANKKCVITQAVVTTKPSPPANVSTNETTCNSVVVNWIPPADNGSAELTQYRVLVYKHSSHLEMNTDVTTMMLSHRVSSLEPGTVYNVEVRAGNVGCFGSTSFTTEPTGVTPIHVSSLQSTSVTVTINGTAGEVYSCTLNDQALNITVGQPHNQTGLAPNTVYTISCKRATNSCHEPKATFTTELAPEIVRNLQRGSVTVSVTENGSIQLQQNITWDPPTSPGAVMKYFIRYSLNASTLEDATLSDTTSNTSIVLALSVTPPSPVFYNIWVAVMTTTQELGNYTLLTIQYNTPDVPQSLEATPQSCEAVLVHWMPPMSDGGLPLKRYTVAYNSTSGQMTLPLSNMRIVLLQGLLEDTTYSLSVSAENVLGSGQPKFVVNRTMPRTSETLFTAQLVSSETVLINSSTSRADVAYLTCTLIPDNGNEMSPFNISFGTSKNVTHLLSDVVYTVKCVAYTENGTDACIEDTRVLVNTVLPQVVNVERGRNSWVDGGQLYQPISWDIPGNGSHLTPDQYVIFYGTNVSLPQQQFSDTTENATLSFVIGLPLPDEAITYYIWVAGRNGSRQGPLSEVLQLNYSEPSAPELTVQALSCQSVNVSWTPPKNDGGVPIIGYKIQYSKGSELAMVVKNTVESVNITELPPNSTIGITVAAENSIGLGEQSMMNLTTYPRSPRTLVSVTAVTAHTVMIVINNNQEDGSITCVFRGKVAPARNINVQQLPQNISGLQPDTNYVLSCLAYNNNGMDPCIEHIVTVLTKPAKVHNVTAVPVQPSETGGDYIHHTISWEKPVNHDHITHYLIQYGADVTSRENGENTLRTVNSTTNSVVLSLPTIATSYSVWVAAVSVAGQGEFSDREEFSYSTPDPPTALSVEAKSCHALRVTWSPPDRTGNLPISGYSITYTDIATNVSNSSIIHNSGAVLLEQLNPGTEYSVRIKAINVIGEGGGTEDTTMTRDRGKASVFTMAISAVSIELHHNLTETGVYYLCNLTHGNNILASPLGVNKNVTTQVTNVTGLLPDTTYRVDCVAYNSTGVEVCLEANTTVTTRPSKVQDVTIRGSTAQSSDSDERIIVYQNVTWDEPPNHHNIQHYAVSYQKQGLSSSNVTETINNVTWVTLELFVQHGESPINYSVQVAAVSSAGLGEFSERIQFSYSRPGKPSNVSVQALSCNKLMVTWGTPNQTGGLPIVGYNVTTGSTVKGLVTEQTILIDHQPGAAYTVKVMASNAIGQGLPAEITGSPQARGKGYVNVTANSAHSILLSHNLTESGVYYLCNVTKVEGEEMKAMDKSVNTQVTNVTGLLPDTTYRVDCVAYNSTGVEVCLEANTTVTTFPGKVQDVRVESSTVKVVDDMTANVNQTISWEELPRHHNIKNYTVSYRMGQEATTSSTIVSTINSATQATLVLSVPRGTGATYSVRVAAVSQYGRGEFSDRVELAYSRPNSPTGLMAVKIECNSIHISWSAPSYNGGVPLERYTVRWIGRGSSLMTSRTDMTAGTVEPLIPNTSYTINVTAVNAIGEGEGSIDFAVTTTSQDKSLPVSLETISSTSLHISTQPPPELTHATVNCTLTAKEDISYIYTVQSVNDTRAQLAINLSPYTTYTATCLVFQDGVDQCYIGNDTTQTYTDKPSASPQGVSILSTSSHSFTMRWDPPPKRQQNGEIVSYEVHYREEGSNSTVVNDTTQGMMYTAEDLTTDRVYQFRVAATTVNGTGPFSNMTEVATIPTVTNLRAVYTTTNSITITWDEPDGKYNVWLYGEATDNIPQNRFIDLINVTGQTTLSIGGLNSFRNYSISVYLETELGNGSNATVTVRTLGREPSASPQGIAILSTSSHSFTMRWDPPPKRKQNGVIVSYEVQYREEGSNSTVVKDTTEGIVYTAEDLTTDRVYQFRVAATTVNGTGPFSEWIHVATIPTVTNLTAVNTTTNSTIITWDQPPQNYSVWLYGEATDNIPQNRFIDLINVTGQTTLSIEGLNSFRNYSISVYLEMELGNGSDATVTVQTLGRAPDSSPTNLTITPTSRSVTLQWSPPPVLSRNGILTHYVVRLANETTMWNITQPHKVASDLRRRREAVSEGVGEETQSLRVQHLKPFTNYTWEVVAVSDFGSSPPSENRRFETGQDVPTHVEDLVVNRDQKTITWTAPTETNGIIVRYTVQYWELGRNDTTEESNTTAEERMFLYSNLPEGVPHKVQVQAATVAGLGESRVVEGVLFSEEQAPAVLVSIITVTRVNDTAVMITWRALTLNQARGFPKYTVSVTNDGKVVSSQSTTSTSVVAGGLMPHTEYNITVQALTAGGTKEGPQSAPVRIEALPRTPVAPLPYWTVAVVVVLILVAAIIIAVVVVIVYKRCRHTDKSKPAGVWKDIPMKERGLLQEGIPAPLDLGPIRDPEHHIQRKEAILRHNFCEHVQKMHQDKNTPFKEEYQSITATPAGVTDSTYKSNVAKNRYVNIFPYDHSRVVLYERDENGSDYINAAYIDAYNRTNGYIATQGPTPDTLADFWQMVWENHAPVIVMLTKLVEKGKRKCERYWAAELNVPYLPGRDLSVTTVRLDTHPEFELRTFKVEKTTSKQEPLVVKHFLYTAWPDHGVPQYSCSMHCFIRERVRPVYKDSPAPLIVHCSAGAGRTGTYMAIDTMMYRLEEREDINIFEYVELMRTRRTQMVQNVSQYIYIHDAVNDYINCKNTTIVAHELRPRIEELRQIDPATESSGFVTEFSLLEEVSCKLCDVDYEFAEDEKIIKANRYRGLCPYSDKYIAKEDGKYINASEVSGYCGQRNFIAAQAPMKHTEEDVWDMIWMEKCSSVVVLCDFKEKTCSTFWPLKMSEPKVFTNIKVCLEEKEEQSHYNKYHMAVSFTDNPDPLKVVVFHYLQWPCHGRPTIPTFLQLMGEVERSQHKAKGPTLVMCNDGMSRTGVLITAMAEVERVKVQGEVDIFQTVKAARSERPHMVSTPVDYEVCHDILVSYLESFDTYANFK